MLLQDGNKDIRHIIGTLDTSRQSLLPQIRMLEKHGLIYHSNDNYGLTSIGKVIVDEMRPFLDTIEALDKNEHYFSTHNTDAMPDELLKRIGEIRNCVLVEPGHVDAHDLNRNYLKETLTSISVYLIFTFMHPDFIPRFNMFLDAGLQINIIDSKELVEKLITEMPDECKYFLSFDNVKIYRYDKDVEISSLTVTDNGFLLRLLTNDGNFSNKQLICMGPEARKWGKDLYDHYLKDATQITEI